MNIKELVRKCIAFPRLLLSIGAFMGLHQIASAQQNCWLTFPSGGSPATITIEGPWTVDCYDVGNTNASHDPAYFLDTVTTGDAEVPPGTYLGWCLDEIDDISGCATSYSTLLFSSCDTNITAELTNLDLAYPETVYVDPAVWNEINYILNHKNGAYFNDIQIAIWTLIGGYGTEALDVAEAGPNPPYNLAEINALIQAATNNAASWQPECGDVIGVIVAVQGVYDGFNPVQLTMIEVPYPCVPCISVTKEIACLGPTNNCGDFGKIAAGYAGACGGGINQPAFCYQITITNCGTIPLTNLIVSDNLLGLLTTNFFTNESQVLAPGAGLTTVFSMSFATNATNTVTVYGDADLDETVTNSDTNYGYTIVTNGTPVSASDSATALVDTAAVTCSLTLTSPYSLPTSTDNALILDAASYYSTPPTVTLNIQVCNTGNAALSDVTLNIPGLSAFNCTPPAPFNLAVGGCQSFQLCVGSVSCPAQMNFNVNVNANIVPDTNHCAIYDITSTNLISVCSSCMGSVICSNCAADLSGTVLVHCNASSSSTNGDTGLSGVAVVLYGANNNALATNTTDANGNYTFANVAAGTYYVQAVPPANYVETFPPGNNNSTLAVTMTACTSQGNVDFGYANTAPPTITVPPGGPLGCNPANLPTPSSVASNVTATVSCGPAVSTNITCMDSTNGCMITRTFTIVVTDIYGNSATNSTLTYTWTHDTTVLTLSGVPAGTNYGCNPSSVATIAEILSGVTANDTCSPATIGATVACTTNGCTVSQIFTITATNSCNDSATAYVTNTWTSDSTVLALSGVPAGKNYGCNPANLPTTTTILIGVTANDTCSPATISATVACSTNSCSVTQIFTITATNSCNDMATAYVTNTWTVDSAQLALSGVPAGTNYGCNPTNTATVASILSGVTANDTCSQAVISATVACTTNGCAISQVFTITATNACNDIATAYVTNTWTSDSTVLALSGVPAGKNLGCNPTNLPTVSNILSSVTANDTCSPAVIGATAAVTMSGCEMVQVFTITATNACGDMAVAYVTNTWTENSSAPVLNVPAGMNLGCNPTNIPTLAGIEAAVSTTNSGSGPNLVANGNFATGDFTGWTVTETGTGGFGSSPTNDYYVVHGGGAPPPTNNDGAKLARSTITLAQTINIPSSGFYTITAWVQPTANDADTFQISFGGAVVFATNYNVGGSYNEISVTVPANAGTNVLAFQFIPGSGPIFFDDVSIASTSNPCSSATVNVSAATNVNGCSVSQIFTISAVATCGQTTTAYVTNTWTSLPLVNITNITYTTNITEVTNITFTTNYTYKTNVVNITNIVVTTNCCTNAICGNFNSQNPGTNSWLWLNAHCSGAPGSNCTIYCQNASVTLACTDGKTYSFPIPNGCVNFSSTCTTGTNWFDGTSWHTTLPCAGDDQIFLQGCAIPWQTDFANCQSVCWNGVFSCSTPGFYCNWQWGAACYSGSAPSCGQIAPKACHQTACPNGTYYAAGDQCGAPENYKPNCVAGGTGGGGANCTGSWSGTSTTCTFGTKTNITVTPTTVITTNSSVVTNTTVVPVSTVTTNTTVTTTTEGPVLAGVPSGKNFGCNPTNVPTVASVEAEVSASETCSAASVAVTMAETTSGCLVTQIFTITASNACGNVTTAYVTNTWTQDTIPPVITGLPTNTFLGCGGVTNVPGDANVLAEITVTDQCSTPGVTVSHQDSTNGCTGMRTFTITAVDACGNTATTNLVYTWTGKVPELCTNSITCAFNSQNPSTNCWLWLNAHCSGNPGQQGTLYCQNATVTLTCLDGKTYTFPVPNGCINFSTNCTTGTNWFDGTNWNTTLPCAGDDEIFLQGCAIPWQSDFASCKSVTWTGVFSCTTPGLSFNWQFGAACYANSKPAYTNICPKACHETSCQNGLYFDSSDHAGCPENDKPYCVAGGTGGGGANCTGSWSGTDTTCTFTSGTVVPPVLNGVPSSDNLGINPTNIPTIASVEAEVTASDTCSPAPVYVTMAETTNNCQVTQIFTISATNDCGAYALAHVTNCWTTLMMTNHCTNTVCTSFNSYNPSTNCWLWCNAHLTGNTATNECLIICSNASVTLTCQNGKTYTYPVPNGQILFSPGCTNATNWYDGTNWNTVLPCGGDDQIFSQGCAIPWLPDFVNCQSVCWTCDFSCNVPGLNFNWQFGASCYSDSLPAYSNICPKACHQTPCQNGYYFNQSDNAGCPENHSPYCVGGGTGNGGSNYSGNWSNGGTCKF